MILYAVGIAHKELAIREQVSFTNQQKLVFQENLYQQGVHSCVIVSTCNRSEVYVVCEQNQCKDVKELYQEFFQLPYNITISEYHHEHAMQHLFEVCAGLDSQIIGEDQIIKQIKDAYAFAQETHMMNKMMHFILQEAFHFAKSCRQDLRLNEHPTSSSYLVYKSIKKLQLTQPRVLLCGAGDVIQQCLPYLSDYPITIVVRNPKRVANIKEQYPELQICHFDDRYRALQVHDILISATASPHPIWNVEDMPKDNQKRYLFDMAVPRDIEVAVNDIKEYKLYDIDQIQGELQVHTQQKQSLLQQAHILVKDAVTTCIARCEQLQKEPVIAQMQAYLTNMAEDTYTLLDKKLSLTSHEQKLMKKTLEYSYLRFLQEFTTLVKASDGDTLAVLEEWSKKGGA